MRVIGGSFRGRRLRAPSDKGTRPTSDRVREAVFDMLDTLVDLDLAGAAVVDLFAGSGAMGIEALSRGAGSVAFVERAPKALRAIRANLDAIGLDPAVDRGTVEMVRAEAVGWLARGRRFDLALADPPYSFDDWDGLLGHLEAGVAVLESDRELAVPVTWEILRHKRYGDTLVTVVRHVDVARPGQKGSP